MYVIWHSRANLSYQLMKHPDFLDNRDFTGEDKKRPSTMSMDSSYQALEGAVKKLSEIASTRHDPRYLQEYIKTGINMAQSAASDHDFTVLIRSGRRCTAPTAFSPRTATSARFPSSAPPASGMTNRRMNGEGIRQGSQRTRLHGHYRRRTGHHAGSQ